MTSGGVEDDGNVPGLVDPPSDSDDEDYFFPSASKYRKVPGKFPWKSETACPQSNFNTQASRWMKLDERTQKIAFGAVKRLLVTPFLFQQLVIPEKWIRWAKVKDMISFDISKKQLPNGKITRQHYLVVKMFDCSLEKLKTLIDKKKTIAAIMKMMHSIRNVSVNDVDRAIKETKANENLKLIVDFIKSEVKGYSQSDRDFFEAVDRISLTALLCMRQFAEVIHIVACEGRDIGTEVRNQFTDHFYYLLEDHKIGREKGNKLFKNGRYQEAIDAYSEAIRKTPFHYLLYSNRCQASIRIGDYESAFSDAYRTVILNPGWGKGYYKVVLCLKELGHLEEALDWGSQGLKRCSDDLTVKSLRELMELITTKRSLQKATSIPKEPQPKVTAENASEGKKNRKTKKKKKAKAKKDEDDADGVPELVSDDEFDECPVTVRKTKKDLEAEKRKEEQRKREEKERKIREEKEREERAILNEFEQQLQKGAAEFLKTHYADACKSYSLSITFAETHKEIRGYTENDFATLLYTRGITSQKQGSAVEIDSSRQYFLRIINEHKMFSHLGMAHYGNAKSTYLLNNFEQAEKQVSTALQMVKKFPIHGMLTWPGSSENIPESDERYLRKEIKVLLQQCKVPPIPSAVCQYEACLKDYTRKQIYFTDLNFEGHFEVRCDWGCVLSFHLRCWAKFKHDHLNSSGDREVLGMPCFTPDCQGKIKLIRMLDEYVMEKKKVESSEDRKANFIRNRTENSNVRMSKSEQNLKKYLEKQEEKKRKKREYSDAKHEDPSSTKEYEGRNQKFSETDFTPDTRDLSEATIYVKNDNSQKTNGNNSQGRGGRRVVPASLHHYCSLLPGYSKDMPLKLLSETIERAKKDGISFTLPDDLQEEIEQVALYLSDDEFTVVFTEDEKIKIPFLLEYFVNFFTEKGPLDSTAPVFTEQLILLPTDMRNIVGKCGSLITFLDSSPLFIQVPPYIGLHSQHPDMKKLTDVPMPGNHVVISQNSPNDMTQFMEFEDIGLAQYQQDVGLSQFAKDFYQVGANVEDIDLMNLTGGGTDSTPNYNQGRMYELDEVPVQRKLKNSQNSETSSMYSLDDITDMKSEFSGQASSDAEKSVVTAARPQTPQKKPPQSVLPQIKKIVPKKKLSTTATQTEGRDEAEKAKEAVARLQERLREVQDDYTKLKRTSQTREEALVKDLEAAQERESIAVKERENIKQAAENEMAKIPHYKKQVQVAESKLEQSRLKEKELEMNLASLTAGMQLEREGHLQEILSLRKAVEIKDKEIEANRRRAIASEINLTKTKEAYHVGAHISAKSHCEQGVREFDVELVKLAAVLPEHIMNHFKLARKQWVDSVVSCSKTIETLKAAYASIIEQISTGRPLSELPPVPELKPPPPGPNPRHMMIQLQRSGAVSGVPKQPISGSGDGNMPAAAVHQPINGTNSPVPGATASKMNPSPLPPVTKQREPAPVKASVPQQKPIGSELPKPPRKKNFLHLVEKLSKNLPQLNREQVEECAQRVRAENKGLTGLLYEEIEKRIREMVGLGLNEQPQRNPGPPAPQAKSVPSIWKIGPTMLHTREVSDFWDLEDEAVCPICCDPLKDGRIHTLECQHKFHYDCISKWMQKQRTCPNCRKFMADTSEFPSLSGPAPPGLLRNHN